MNTRREHLYGASGSLCAPTDVPEPRPRGSNIPQIKDQIAVETEEDEGRGEGGSVVVRTTTATVTREAKIPVGAEEEEREEDEKELVLQEDTKDGRKIGRRSQCKSRSQSQSHKGSESLKGRLKKGGKYEI